MLTINAGNYTVMKHFHLSEDKLCPKTVIALLPHDNSKLPGAGRLIELNHIAPVHPARASCVSTKPKSKADVAFELPAEDPVI